MTKANDTTPFRELHPVAKVLVVVFVGFLAVILALLLAILTGWLWNVTMDVWQS